MPEFKELQNSIYYLHVGELRAACKGLALSSKGTKASLINIIMHFIKTGEKLELPDYPEVSRIKKGQRTPSLDPSSLMLKGVYKNDLKTRNFFKELIGPKFHFTAFGIDWLEERWLAGKPPTYQEFANMWQKESNLRKNVPAAPKEVWAYIIFVKDYLLQKPDAKKQDLLNAWNKERLEHKTVVFKYLSNLK